MRNQWVEKKIHLKFLFGEITILTNTFPGLVLNTNSAKVVYDSVELCPPIEKFSSKLEVMLIRSHPIRVNFPCLSLSGKYFRYVPNQYRRYYIDLQGSFDDYMKKFSSKSRSTLGRKVRKFAELSGEEVWWREYRYPDEMDDFYQLAREVSRKTYQERLLDVGLPDNDKFRQEISNLAAHDLVRSYILFVKNIPVSYLFCPVQEDVLSYQYLGYDPEYRRWSPGTVLLYVALRKLFTEGRFRFFDFTEGEGSQKEFFSTGNALCADVYYFRRTFQNLLFLGFHSSFFLFSNTIVKVLELFGLRARIKRFFRFRL